MGLALAVKERINAFRPQAEPRRGLERLLVVDDERLASSMISLRLRQSGFHVETARSGAEALSVLDTKTFDLVLLDRVMPGYSGDQVLKELRQSHSASDLPVIMVSALDDSQQVAEALEMGANDYITKPIDFTVAVARIRSQLVRKRVENGAPRLEGDGLWDWDLESDRVHYCDRWAAMVGLDRDELTDEPGTWFSRVHPQDLSLLQKALQAHRDGKTEAFEMQYRVVCKDGGFRWMSSRGMAFRDVDGKAIRMAGAQTDITTKKTIDSLTGLPNRILFVDHLTAALETKCLNPGLGLAVLVVNVDQFKRVNDSLGHEAGDQLLIEFCKRIRAVVLKWRSAADGRQNSMVARLGGDKFAAVLDGVSSPMQAVSIADEMLQALRRMLIFEEREFGCTASIGVALSGQRYQAAEDLLKDADAAMYSATAGDKDCWALFSESMLDRSIDARSLESDLRTALREKQLRVYYQPRVDLNTERILGFEALVRWAHPRRGLLVPSEFIPVAEQTGLIREVGLWVMEEACLQISKWQTRFPMDPTLDVAVNVSPVQLKETDFVEQVRKILKRTGLVASGLQLELTESVLVDDLDVARRKLAELKAIGVGLKMDDFATGFSSLRYLSKLPFDTLKIDRSFINELDDERGVTKEIVRTILNMASSLSMGVIAEGIEEPKHLECLRELGCRYGQGFYFSEPVDAVAIERLLAIQQRRDEAEGLKQLHD